MFTHNFTLASSQIYFPFSLNSQIQITPKLVFNFPMLPPSIWWLPKPQFKDRPNKHKFEQFSHTHYQNPSKNNKNQTHFQTPLIYTDKKKIEWIQALTTYPWNYIKFQIVSHKLKAQKHCKLQKMNNNNRRRPHTKPAAETPVESQAPLFQCLSSSNSCSAVVQLKKSWSC